MKSILFTAFFAFVAAGLFSGSAPGPSDGHFQQQAKKVQEKETGWLGVSISNVDKAKADELKLKATDGAYVASVVDDSPADSIGLKKGDVITSFAGRLIYDADDLSQSVRRTSPGTKITLEILRDGGKKSLSVIIGTMPSRDRYVMRVPRGQAFTVVSTMGTQGMRLLELNDQLAKYFDAPEGEGVLVTEVKKSSAAEKAGLQAGDVLVRIAGKRIDEVSDVSRILRSFDEGEKAEIELIRKGTKKTVAIAVEENDPTWHIYSPEGSFQHRLFVPGNGEFEFDFDVEEPDMRELELKLENLDRSLKLKENQLRETIERSVRLREIRAI